MVLNENFLGRIRCNYYIVTYVFKGLTSCNQ